MRRFLPVFELILTLQGLDESFLREILSIVDIADHAVDLQEDSAQVFGEKAILCLGGQSGHVREHSGLRPGSETG